MNTRPPIESPSATMVLSITFNDDNSCFAVGLNSGFNIFHSGTCSLRTARDFNAGIGLVQMMGNANLIALVGGGRQPKFAANKVVIWDDQRSKSALEISALTPVRGAQLSKERVVLVLQNSVRMYKFAKQPTLLSAYETANNAWGLCCLKHDKLVFPGRTTGHVQLVDVPTGNVSIIPAHSSALRAIQLSKDGDLLATASETGTLIRVFSTGNCARLVELRRGIDPATIFSLAFSPSGMQLACTSDKSTLHIFDIPHTNSSKKAQPSSPRATPVVPHSPGLGIAGNGTAFPPTNPSTQPSTGGETNDEGGRGKWGILARIPLMPRLFSDVYSFASAPFEVGDEPLVGGLPMSGSTTLGTARPPKGVVGWLDEESLLVVGGGLDARWEKFMVVREVHQDGVSGRRVCVREGWKRYLGSP
ncbi:WD40-repeat-containing domain protein [Apodospora peruviana]|uniref:WD40-repeat-containing domain protein n=1 Tax=Apodospora peruviana TaxID=516989 RepID=A0AAE0MGE7_9PEZI|nr:WD40-repeat-containing domain protein [Apodospora peruviana]